MHASKHAPSCYDQQGKDRRLIYFLLWQHTQLTLKPHALNSLHILYIQKHFTFSSCSIGRQASCHSGHACTCLWIPEVRISMHAYMCMAYSHIPSSYPAIFTRVLHCRVISKLWSCLSTCTEMAYIYVIHSKQDINTNYVHLLTYPPRWHIFPFSIHQVNECMKLCIIIILENCDEWRMRPFKSLHICACL